MKRYTFALLFFLISADAYAYLAASAITNFTLKLYGMYTTTDPTCQTGWVATLPLQATPTTYNMASNPTLGTGNIAAPTQCVAVIVSNAMTIAWAAGTYTSTTTISSTTYNDSNCNSGGSIQLGQPGSQGGICFSPRVAAWPTQIADDMNAAGLTMTTNCPAMGAMTGNEIFPIYLSTNSACTFVPGEGDPSNCSFDLGLPENAGDIHDGLKMAETPAKSSYTFINNISNLIGGYTSNLCGPVGAPAWGFQ